MAIRNYLTYLRTVALLSLAVISLLTAPETVSGQSRQSAGGMTLRGTVRDSITGEPLPYVNIYVNSTQGGAVSDEKGAFYFRSGGPVDRITISSLGYRQKVVAVNGRNAGKLRILLAPADYALEEVVVRPKKEKYSKKNNPAVEFMERLRAAADGHDPTREPFYSFDKQEKIVLGMADYDSILPREEGKERRMAFLNDFLEPVSTSEKPVLKISVRERRATDLYTSSPQQHREYTEAVRSAGIDRSINQDNIQIFLNDLLREIDIYRNDITLIQNRFVSPLSPIAADYYKFYMDTVMLGGERCIELTFLPRTPESMGFNGKLYVPVNDSTMTVRRLTMRVPKSINLNYVRDLCVEQEFQLDSLGNRRKVFDDVAVDFALVPGTQALYAAKTTRYHNFSYDRRDDLDRIYRALGEEHAATDADSRDDSYWEQGRLVALTPSEAKMGDMVELMRKNPWFRYPEKIVSWLVNGYICTSKKRSLFDIGNITSFISFNTAEGLRLRFGGMTTANLSPHWLGRGYVAYGFRDHRWKYQAEAEYSFNRRKYHSREFPMHAIRLTHQYDLDALGQRYGTQPDNILLSIRRRESYKVTYRRFTSLQYILELRNHLSLDLSLNHETQQGTRWLPFILPDGSILPSYSQAYASIELRYSPGEKFIQGNTSRTHVNLDAPVITLHHEFGPKGLLGSRYNLNLTTLSVKKRFWFSSFGYADVQVQGGKIWSSVDFPSLLWPAANLSYTIQQGAYSLMNPMEFAVDQYAAWDITYCGNGILFNRLPLLKKLHLRETLGFKGLFGGLTKRNNPAYNRTLFPFPEDADAHLMKPGTPYMECSVGLDNVLTLFRVEYVWRLTYRNLPGIDRGGVRFGIHFAF